MSGAVHTPGPWEVVNLSGVGGPYSIRMVYSGDKHFYGVRGIHRKEDARLIAAAPELLRALENLTNAATGTTGFASPMFLKDAQELLAHIQGGAA